ncbi:MAG: fumarylacetoacetate hydrolase family protein [Pseudobdellovibrionaceae bacterium]|nr:fumarylacetoacetate hydrolase family protein [Bdellovibrionales bacterium]USN46629.1 MAG: fumarylacetoacetate hydrolase family protein [Pseudobdellovibrionaceae bacterium]
MKLGSIKGTGRDGELVVVSKDNQSAVRATNIAPSLREAVENWQVVRPQLQAIYDKLNKGDMPGTFSVDERQFHSPMPRSFQWADGSAFIHHIKLVRKARNADLPETLLTVPLMYQGGSDCFLAPTDDIPQRDFSHGTDFEGEVGVIVDDTPMGVSAEDALKHIILFVVINDVSLRGLIPEELKQGFGFFQGKPSTAFAPFAVTEDELGLAYREGRIHLPLLVDYNSEFFGNADAGAMHFHFGELIAHAAKTRDLKAGTIIGSGTVSNEDASRGSSCLAEKRMIEKINEGAIKTPFMKVGDTIEIKMLGPDGQNIFGTIKQKVAQA